MVLLPGVSENIYNVRDGFVGLVGKKRSKQ